MRKGLLALTLILVMASSRAFAVEDVQAEIILPKTYEQKAGDAYHMALKIILPADYKTELKTFTLSFLVDQSITIEKATLEGNLSDNDYRLRKTKKDDTSKEIVTLVIGDVKVLRGREFVLNMQGKFKKGTKGINKVTASYVMSIVDRSNKSKSLQKNVSSEKGQAKATGLNIVDPIYAGDNTLTGKSPANTNIRIYRSKTLIGSGVAKSDGTFSVVINPQPEGSKLSFEFTMPKQKETLEVSVLKAQQAPIQVNPTMEKIEDYTNLLSSIPMNRAPHVDKLQVNAAIATAQFVLAKNNVSDEEANQAFERLKEAMGVARPGYMSGYPNGTFGPSKPMTRAEVSAVFTRIINRGAPAVGFSSFKDIDDSKWYASSVGFMEKKGLIGGYKDGTFKPQNAITRAEFAKILASYMDLDTIDGASDFSDVKQSHWANGYIVAVNRAGLMNGHGKNRFSPSGKITRQEVSAALNRALGRRVDKAFLDRYGANAFKDVNQQMWSYYDILEATGTGN